MPEGNSDLERISGSEPLPASLEPVRPRLPMAWEPVTPRGVAAFALARWGRFFVVASLVAALASGTVVWFVNYAWSPIISNAIARLPDTGYIQGQQLYTLHASPEPLALNPFLGVGVDPEARSNANVGTDIYVKFHRQEVLFCSFLGCNRVAYPAGWTIQFNRRELEPWWGAWKIMIFGMAFLSIAVWLLGTWLVLGLLYAPVVWLVARHRGRKLDAAACWRLGSACNLPGALALTVGIVAYGIGPLSLFLLCVLFLGHVIPAWVYLFLCPQHIPAPPARPDSKGPNPFMTARSQRDSASGNLFHPKT